MQLVPKPSVVLESFGAFATFAQLGARVRSLDYQGVAIKCGEPSRYGCCLLQL